MPRPRRTGRRGRGPTTRPSAVADGQVERRLALVPARAADPGGPVGERHRAQPDLRQRHGGPEVGALHERGLLLEGEAVEQGPEVIGGGVSVSFGWRWGEAARTGDDVAVPVRAVRRDPPLRLEVDVDDAEALRVAPRPLEVVQERPDEIATHVDAPARSPRDAARVALEVPDAPESCMRPSSDRVVVRRRRSR